MRFVVLFVIRGVKFAFVLYLNDAPTLKSANNVVSGFIFVANRPD